MIVRMNLSGQVLLALFAASVLLLSLPAPLQAAELLMFEEAGCPWCRKWRVEVGPGYPKSPEGQRAPLRVIDIHGKLPPGITLASPVRASPTFVLVEDGREVGRIVGYPGADFFWGLLDGLIRKLDAVKGDAPAPRTSVSGPEQTFHQTKPITNFSSRVE